MSRGPSPLRRPARRSCRSGPIRVARVGVEFGADQEAGGQPRARFYAHLYRGLYHAAFGRTEAAREEIFLAADDQFAEVGGYMHMVAVVHRNLLGR